MGAARVVAVRWMVIATARHRRPHTRAAVRRPPYPCPVVRAADLPVPSTRLHQQRPAHIHRRAARTRPRRRLHWTNDIRPAPPENPQPDHPDRGHPPLPSHRPRPGYREVPHLRPGPRIALRPRRTRHRHTHPRPSTIRRHRIPHRGRKPHHGSIIRVTKHQPPQPQSNTTEPDPHTTDLTQKSGFAGLAVTRIARRACHPGRPTRSHRWPATSDHVSNGPTFAGRRSPHSCSPDGIDTRIPRIPPSAPPVAGTRGHDRLDVCGVGAQFGECAVVVCLLSLERSG